MLAIEISEALASRIMIVLRAYIDIARPHGEVGAAEVTTSQLADAIQLAKLDQHERDRWLEDHVKRIEEIAIDAARRYAKGQVENIASEATDSACLHLNLNESGFCRRCGISCRTQAK